MIVRNLIEDMQQYASERGGKCLSKEYWDDISRLMWMCEKGHVWESPWRVISRGAWCPKCAKDEEKEEKEKERQQKRLEEIRNIAKEKGGKCLTSKYINNYSKMQFQCAESHSWENTFKNISKGVWCQVCEKDKRNEKMLEELRTIAREKGGKLLSDNYHRNNLKLLWECGKGHQWFTSGANVKLHKYWCPYCAGMHKTIKDMQDIAAKRGGKCLSKEYLNYLTKLEWQCNEGHIWSMIPGAVISGKWCPVYRQKHRAENPKYSIEMYQKLAIERGGRLISDKPVLQSDKLLWECGKGHQWEATGTSIIHGETWCPYCCGLYKTIEQMREWAAKKGGQCLSKEYINALTKLEWQCSEGHIWKATPLHIINSNSWCPKCAVKTNSERSKDTIEKYKKIAIDHGGKLLSEKYINSNTKLLWQCSKGHTWESKPNIIAGNHWCRICGYEVVSEKHKDNIEIFQKIATQHGGKLLSDKYIDGKTPLLWECQNGHQWKTAPSTIKNNKSWCPICFHKTRGELQKDDIEIYKKIAIERGGELLSEQYINNKTALLWECSNGHQWNATPDSIKNSKSWCPHCYKINRGIKTDGKAVD